MHHIRVSCTTSTMLLGQCLLRLGQPVLFNSFTHSPLASTSDVKTDTIYKRSAYICFMTLPSLPWQLYWYARSILLVSAEQQTHGLGQQGRTWYSPPGQVYMTLHLPIKTRCLPSYMGIETGVTILDFISHLIKQPLPPQMGLKWPNDLFYINYQREAPALYKWGVILCEITPPPLNPYFCVGVGININSAPRDPLMSPFSPSGYKSAALKELLPGFVPELDNLEELINQLAEYLLASLLDALILPKSLAERFSQVHLFHGKTVVIDNESSAEKTTGIVIGINDQGNLMIKKANHCVLNIHSGRIRLLLQNDTPVNLLGKAEHLS